MARPRKFPRPLRGQRVARYWPTPARPGSSIRELTRRPLNRAAMMVSEPAMGVPGVMRVVCLVFRVVGRLVRRRRLFRESQRPGERNHKCGKSRYNQRSHRHSSSRSSPAEAHASDLRRPSIICRTDPKEKPAEAGHDGSDSWPRSSRLSQANRLSDSGHTISRPPLARHDRRALCRRRRTAQHHRLRAASMTRRPA
jgi:hypothetical protein